MGEEVQGQNQGPEPFQSETMEQKGRIFKTSGDFDRHGFPHIIGLVSGGRFFLID